MQAVLAIACGGGETPTTAPTAAPLPTPTKAATATPTREPIAPTPTQSALQSDVITIDIGSLGEQLKFTGDELTVTAGTEVMLRFKNNSAILSHNWVLVEFGTKDGVAGAGVAAGPGNDWIPQGDERIVAHTKLVDPGMSGQIRFTAPGADSYQFVCTFPGHNVTMFGLFEVTP